MLARGVNEIEEAGDVVGTLRSLEAVYGAPSILLCDNGAREERRPNDQHKRGYGAIAPAFVWISASSGVTVCAEYASSKLNFGDRPPRKR